MAGAELVSTPSCAASPACGQGEGASRRYFAKCSFTLSSAVAVRLLFPEPSYLSRSLPRPGGAGLT